MHTFAPEPHQVQPPEPSGLSRSDQPAPRSFSQALLTPATQEIQTKLTINEPGDAHEQEADRLADHVMRTPEPQLQRACACGGGCPRCQTSQKHVQLQTKHIGASDSRQTAVPPIVHEVLRSPGQPLDATTRSSMESRFGHDFSDVRMHTDPLAARSAEAVAAQAYTVGADVVFGAGRYAPESRDGQRLLAHELAHVVQQRGAGGNRSLQRFHLPHGTHPDDETPLIAPTYNDMLATLKAAITASTNTSLLGDSVNMDTLMRNVAGHTFAEGVGKKLGTESLTPKNVKTMLNYRYLFTCRCGLIDMLHFLQLLYVAHVAAGMLSQNSNRSATRKGKEHELDTSHPAASESRFGPEDLTSNALGAFTARGLAGEPDPDDLFDAIKGTLSRCDPIGFKSLSAASQDKIRHFYGDLIADPANPSSGHLIPKNQNMTAIPFLLDIPECGGRERSFPFSMDSDDEDRKTISGKDFEKGSTDLKSGSSIRDFINNQRAGVLMALPISEKIRMLRVLLGGKVSDDDIHAAQWLSKVMTPAEKAIWQQQLPLPTDD